MEIKAKLNYLRIAPRKVRLIADVIENMDAKQAKTQLKFTPKRSTEPLLKLLKSAIANAKTNFNIEEDALFVKKILVNEGPPFKRWQARARGRAFPILKRTSHVNLILGVKEGVKVEKPIKKAKPAVKPEEVKEVETKESEEKKAEKLKYRAPKEISKRPERKGLFKKIFRRKSF